MATIGPTLPTTGDTGSITTARIAWFSDALVGIVATLLIADLVGHVADLPSQASGAPDAVVVQWLREHVWFAPAHVLSFATVFFLWRRHREIFRHLRALNRTQVWLNAGFLATLCLFPFATSLVARSEASALAMVVFFTTVAAALAWLWLLLATARHAGLVVDDSPGVMRPLTVYVAGPLASVAAGLAIVAVGEALAIPYAGVAAVAVTIVVAGGVIAILGHLLNRAPARQPPGDDLDDEPDSGWSLLPGASSGSTLSQFFAGSSVDRMLLLTDGVYAIAVTVMAVLLIPAQDDLQGQGVATAMTQVLAWDEGPSNFWLFLLLFAALYRIWLLHVRIFRLVADVGILAEWVNGIHLFLVAWIPIAFAVMIAAPPAAVLPWWLLTGSLLLVLLSVAVLAVLVLVRHRRPTIEASMTLRLVLTRSGLDALTVLIVLAPLGLPLIGVVPALLMDPLTNLLWRPAAPAPNRSWRQILLADPAKQLGSRANPTAVLLLILIMGVAVVIAWHTNGFFLLHPR